MSVLTKVITLDRIDRFYFVILSGIWTTILLGPYDVGAKTNNHVMISSIVMKYCRFNYVKSYCIVMIVHEVSSSMFVLLLKYYCLLNIC